MTQDLDAFRARHGPRHVTAIRYAVAHDDDAWVEEDDQLVGRRWITVTRPGDPLRQIEVVFGALFRGDSVLRLSELTWPDWSGLEAFADY